MTPRIKGFCSTSDRCPITGHRIEVTGEG